MYEMGRWLDALKKHENAQEDHPQNPQKLPKKDFEGFEGPSSGEVEEYSKHDERAPASFLKASRTPLSGETLSSYDSDGDSEERAAILEYDAGLSRDEAERTAAFHNGAAPIGGKLDIERYAEALKQHGPTSYGAIGVILGWGMTRSAEAETILRKAGLIQYDNAGRGRYVGP
jgi:hypothetical protein